MPPPCQLRETASGVRGAAATLLCSAGQTHVQSLGGSYSSVCTIAWSRDVHYVDINDMLVTLLRRQSFHTSPSSSAFAPHTPSFGPPCKICSASPCALRVAYSDSVARYTLGGYGETDHEEHAGRPSELAQMLCSSSSRATSIGTGHALGPARKTRGCLHGGQRRSRSQIYGKDTDWTGFEHLSTMV